MPHLLVDLLHFPAIAPQSAFRMSMDRDPSHAVIGDRSASSSTDGALSFFLYSRAASPFSHPPPPFPYRGQSIPAGFDPRQPLADTHDIFQIDLMVILLPVTLSPTVLSPGWNMMWCNKQFLV
jgi:hypothetical protein